jgi:hypothetical protein
MSTAISDIDPDIDSTVEPLPSGDPLRAFFPHGTNIKEDREGLIVLAPGWSNSVRYQRTSRNASQIRQHKSGKTVIDVIIMGEVRLFQPLLRIRS